jgi:hypothetical protein
MILNLKQFERPIPHTVRNAIDAFNGDSDITPSFDPLFLSTPYAFLTSQNKEKLQRRLSKCLAKSITPEVAYSMIVADAFRGEQFTYSPFIQFPCSNTNLFA